MVVHIQPVMATAMAAAMDHMALMVATAVLVTEVDCTAVFTAVSVVMVVDTEVVTAYPVYLAILVTTVVMAVAF